MDDEHWVKNRCRIVVAIVLIQILWVVKNSVDVVYNSYLH